MTLAEAHTCIDVAHRLYQSRCVAIVEGSAADGDNTGAAYDDYVFHTAVARQTINEAMLELLKG